MRTTTDLSGHVIVCGDDALAVRVLEELHDLDEPVCALAIGEDSALARRARELDAAFVDGSPASEEALRAAGLERAAALALLRDDDVENLHAALVARDLTSGARIVLRVPDRGMRTQLDEVLGDCALLADSELAAPALAHAALHGDAALPVMLAGATFAIREVAGDDPRLELALADADDAARLFPEGTANRVLGLVRTDAPAGDGGGSGAGAAVDAVADAAARVAAAVPHPSGARLLWRQLRAAVGGRLGVALVVLVSLIVVSSLIFGLTLDITPLDAVYFTVVTSASVGYGDISLLDAPTAVKVYGIGMILAGTGTIAITYALVTDAIVGARLAAVLGDPEPPTANHVIVCGMGDVGGRVAAELSDAGVEWIGIDRDEQAPGMVAARRAGRPVRLGDPSRPETLADLNLDSARAIMALTNDDAVNLQCALAARARHPGVRVVLRLSDADLAARVERHAAIHISRSVSRLAAPAFAAALLDRRAPTTIPVGPRALRTRTLPAPAAASVAALTDGVDARILSVHGTWAPASIEAGDELLALGTSRGLAELARRLSAAGGAA